MKYLRYMMFFTVATKKLQFFRMFALNTQNAHKPPSLIHRTIFILPRALISITSPCVWISTSDKWPLVELPNVEVKRIATLQPEKKHRKNTSKAPCDGKKPRFQCSMGWTLLLAEWFSGNICGYAALLRSKGTVPYLIVSVVWI